MEDLSKLFKLNSRTIQEKLDNYEVIIKDKEPREFTAVVDSTFFGKRKDKFGVAVILDIKKKEILKWKHIRTERKEHHQFLTKELERKGYIFEAVTIDGFNPLFIIFSDIPIQICVFHQKAIIRRYLTKNQNYRRPES